MDKYLQSVREAAGAGALARQGVGLGVDAAVPFEPSRCVVAMEKGAAVKYVLTWRERPGGSAKDYEEAQQRVLSVFSTWEMPAALSILQFLVRVGEFGGYAVVETDDAGAIHRLTTVFAVFEFKVEPVMDVMEAVAVETEAISWRDSQP